jgi:hypothetical protein
MARGPQYNRRWHGPHGGRGGSAPGAGEVHLTDDARGFAWDCCNLGKGEVSNGPEYSAVRMTSHRHGRGDGGGGQSGQNGWPLKAHGFTEFGRCVMSTCPAPSDKRAQLKGQPLICGATPK